MAIPTRFIEIEGNLVEFNKVMAVMRVGDNANRVTFKSRRLPPLLIGDEAADRLKKALMYGPRSPNDGQMFNGIRRAD